MERPGQPVTVVLIAGYGRSGSTLLERLLGQIPGLFAAGELCHVWERGFVENQLCGCGEPFGDCEFWAGVRETLQEAGSPPPDFAQIAVQAGSLVRARNSLPLAFSGLAGPGLRLSLAEYRTRLGKLYRSIARAAGTDVVIDSSKSPLHGFVAAGIPGIDLRVIHLVRDSRAVAFSWMRRKDRPEVHWRREQMPRFGPTRSAVVWAAKNVLSERLAASVPAATRMRYEALVARPAATLEFGLSEIGLAGSSAALSFLTDDRAELEPNHTAAGNPFRFETGSVELRSDRQWQEQMRRSHYHYVTALTWPLLKRYGYSIGT